MKKISLILFLFYCKVSIAQIPNSDFEIWYGNVAKNFISPDRWGVYAKFTAPYNIDSVTVYHGKYSLRMNTVCFHDDNNENVLIETAFKLSQHPKFITAYVKDSLDTTNGDTLVFLIRLFNNSIKIDSGVTYVSAPINNFTPITIPISQNSNLADSAFLQIRGLCHQMNSQSSIFWVDYMSVDNLNSISFIENNKESISINPNPITSSSIVSTNGQFKNAELFLYDIFGKEMLRKNFSGNSVEIEKGNLASGIYFVKVKAAEKEFVEKLIVE